jgi:hypothetical protein
MESARRVATAVLAGKPGTSPFTIEIAPSTGAPSTANRTLTIFLPGSGRTVACRSNRCPATNREMTGERFPEANSSLGGVSLDTVGAATMAAEHAVNAAPKNSLLIKPE